MVERRERERKTQKQPGWGRGSGPGFEERRNGESTTQWEEPWKVRECLKPWLLFSTSLYMSDISEKTNHVRNIDFFHILINSQFIARPSFLLFLFLKNKYHHPKFIFWFIYQNEQKNQSAHLIKKRLFKVRINLKNKFLKLYFVKTKYLYLKINKCFWFFEKSRDFDAFFGNKKFLFSSF